MADNAASNLAELEGAGAAWYGRRLRYFFSRTTNQGLGPFLAFAVALTASFIFARCVYFKVAQDRLYVTRLLETELQPMSEVTRGAVLSIVLQALNEPGTNLTKHLECHATDIGDCPLGRKIQDRTQLLIELADRIKESGGVRALPPEFRADLLQVFPAPQLIEERVQQLLSAVDPATTAPPEDSCKDARGKERAERFHAAVAVCEDSAASHTVQVVPQHTADAIGNSTEKRA
jgi:hypothetical protein